MNTIIKNSQEVHIMNKNSKVPEQSTVFKTSDKKVPCLVYSRVVGYYRPTSSYNKGKVEEWSERGLINSNFGN